MPFVPSQNYSNQSRPVNNSVRRAWNHGIAAPLTSHHCVYHVIMGRRGIPSLGSEVTS